MESKGYVSKLLRPLVRKYHEAVIQTTPVAKQKYYGSLLENLKAAQSKNERSFVGRNTDQQYKNINEILNCMENVCEVGIKNQDISSKETIFIDAVVRISGNDKEISKIFIPSEPNTPIASDAKMEQFGIKLLWPLICLYNQAITTVDKGIRSRIFTSFLLKLRKDQGRYNDQPNAWGNIKHVLELMVNVCDLEVDGKDATTAHNDLVFFADLGNFIEESGKNPYFTDFIRVY